MTTTNVKITELAPFPDEPPFALFEAVAICPACQREIRGTAASDEAEDSRSRAKGEALERTALCRDADTRRSRGASFEEFDPEEALNPRTILGVPRLRQKERSGHSTRRGWCEVLSHFDGRRLYIPEEMATLRHNSNIDSEVREPLTTGTAYGVGKAEATRRGVLELLERDAYMRAVTQNETVQRIQPGIIASNIRKALARYHLESHIFGIQTIAGGVAILALLIDYTGVGPSLTAGISCSQDVEEAVKKAVFEAWQPRQWLRIEMAGVENQPVTTLPRTPLERGLYWSSPARLSAVRKLLNLNAQVSRWPNSPGPPIEAMLQIMADKGVRLYDSELEKLPNGCGIVVRMSSPDLLPLYLDEQYRYNNPRARQSPIPSPHFFI